MSGNHKHTTVPEHIASSHRRYAAWTIERVRMPWRSGPRPWRCAITFSTSGRILSRASAPALASSGAPDPYGGDRLEAAATRAIDIGARTYGSVKIHSRQQFRSSSRTQACGGIAIVHANIGGPRYYNWENRRDDTSDLDQLHALGLHGMAKASVDIQGSGDAASLDHAEWLALLLEGEASLRHDKRLSARLRYA